MSLDNLASVAESNGAAILGGALAGVVSEEPRWDEIEACSPANARRRSTHDGVARAREWLLAGGRRLERIDRRRRFAVSIGATVVFGELTRVWIASDQNGDRRVLVGTTDGARREIERRVAARVLGLPETAVAALVGGPDPSFVP